jgi:hypothetical protein
MPSAVPNLKEGVRAATGNGRVDRGELFLGEAREATPLSAEATQYTQMGVNVASLS